MPNFINDPSVFWAAVAAVAAIIAVISNAPNPRERVDILKCEILNFVQTTYGLKAWTWTCIAQGYEVGRELRISKDLAKYLDIQRSSHIFPKFLRKGILAKIFKTNKYSKRQWRIYIIAAISELKSEGHDFARICETVIDTETIIQWAEELVEMLKPMADMSEKDRKEYMEKFPSMEYFESSTMKMGSYY